MEKIFIELLNMSITASWLVFVILLLRLIFKKAPKSITVVLWALVGLRLICPFSVESVLSLVPSAETIPLDILYSKNPTIHTGVGLLNSSINPVISESLAPNPGDSVNPMQVIMYIASYIWIIGMIAMILYVFLSYWRIHRKIREAVRMRDNVWMCDKIATPFILGVFRPQIYLPSNVKENDVPYILAHEMAHIKRHDHWWKPLGFALLTIHWFNPMIWIAYILLCRDIELACDEKVIKEMGIEIKKSYSEALINCSIPRKTIAACPLAFGEVGVKERVKTVLNYKKPAFWIVLCAITVCVIIAVCFMTNPKGNKVLGDDTQFDTQQENIQETKIVEWFDYHRKLHEFNKILEIELPGRSDVKFQWKEGEVSVIDSKGTTELIYGMAVACWNGYFYDLTGDGIPELCTTVSVGSGIVDERIVVYDYVKNTTYQLEGRSDNFSYVLSMIGDELIVSKYNMYIYEEVLEQGVLCLKEDNQTGKLELTYNKANEKYTLSSGIYLAGIKPEDADPTSGDLMGQYFSLDTKTQTFQMGESLRMSFAIFGTYEFDGTKLTLATGDESSDVYVLYLNDKGSFVYNESESDVIKYKWIKDGMAFGLMPQEETKLSPPNEEYPVGEAVTIGPLKE